MHCWAQCPWVSLVSLDVTLDSAETSFAKAPLSKQPQKYPVFPFLAFFEFLVFYSCEEFLAFLSVFPFFSMDFRGSVGIKILVFLVVFLAIFQKRERNDRVGS